MRIVIPAAAFAAFAATAVPASAAQCGCVHHRVVHRTAYAPVRHHVRRVAVVERVVYRPRVVEVVRPVYRPIVYRPHYRPIHRVFVEPIWRPRPVFYGARFAPRPHYGFRHDGFRHEGFRGAGFRGEGFRGEGFRHDGFRSGGGWNRSGYGWR
jgi:uncharacterized membrane protein YgcG